MTLTDIQTIGDLLRQSAHIAADLDGHKALDAMCSSSILNAMTQATYAAKMSINHYEHPEYKEHMRLNAMLVESQGWIKASGQEDLFIHGRTEAAAVLNRAAEYWDDHHTAGLAPVEIQAVSVPTAAVAAGRRKKQSVPA